MTEEYKDNPIDCREQVEDAAADLLAGEKAKSLIWTDGDIGVEYFYVNSRGVLVIHRAFENKIAEWLRPLIEQDACAQGEMPDEVIANGGGARGLLEYLWPGCVFKGDSE